MTPRPHSRPPRLVVQRWHTGGVTNDSEAPSTTTGTIGGEVVDVDAEGVGGEALDGGGATEDAVTSDGPGLDRAARRPSLTERIKQTDRVQLAIVAMIGLMFVVFLRGVSLGQTGADRYTLGAHIESVDPNPNSEQVTARAPIRVDLDEGYYGVLTIDGTELETADIRDFQAQDPGVQVTLPPVTIYAEGPATLTFQPQSGSAIEKFNPGIHEVTVRYWKLTDGAARARSYTWTFEVV